MFDLKDSLTSKLNSAFGGENLINKVAGGAVGKLFGSPIDWIKGKAAAIGDFVSDSFTGAVDGAKRMGNKAAVRGVATPYGWGFGKQWNAIVDLVQKESSWDTGAANGKSSARGLFQKMTSVHGPVEKTAAGQAIWGLNYIKDRYGNPVNAWDHWQRNGSYSAGGLVTPTLYDGGGWLRNTGEPQLIDHKKSKPDAVLTTSQWESVVKSIEVSRKLADGGQATTVYNIQTPQGATVDDLTAALRFEKRKQNRGGVHSAI